MIISRRSILESALALPLCSPEKQVRRRTILTEDHCLAAESATGFRMALDPNCYVVVAAASRSLTAQNASQLKRHAVAGALVLFEIAPAQSQQQAQRLTTEFQLRCDTPKRLSGRGWHGEYVEYIHPIRRLVRPFLSTVPVYSPTAQVLAHVNETPVAVVATFGTGSVVFLGSLLGPALYAGDREAHDVIAALIKNNTSSRTESPVDRSGRPALK